MTEKTTEIHTIRFEADGRLTDERIEELRQAAVTSHFEDTATALAELQARRAVERPAARKSFEEKKTYAASELIFAAFSRCPCGAGLAYPEGIGPHGSWDCSAILMGTASKEEHTDRLPFTFYEVKSERQPSANGATTRPKGGS